MIRKSLLCLLAVAACSPGTDGPDVNVTELVGGAAPLVIGAGVLSPDGTRLAYSMQLEGVAAIFVSAANGSNPVRLTHGIWDLQPWWSPDGRSIAYYSDHNADVWVVPSDGGESRQITSGPAADNPLGWLRDGNGVIVIRRGVGDDQTLVQGADGSEQLLFGSIEREQAPGAQRDGGEISQSRRVVGEQESGRCRVVGGKAIQLQWEGRVVHQDHHVQ